jgi:superfamily II DNA or RNA helicase
MAWSPGDRVIVRGADWRVSRSTSFTDCEALDLAHEYSAATRTLLVPFDRPRSPSGPRLQVVSRKRWAREVCSLLRRSQPYGSLQRCPESIRLLPYQLEPALAVLRHGAARLLIADDVGLGKTVEAGLIVRELAMQRHLSRTLILSPAAVRNQWSQELTTLFGVTAIDADAAWLRRTAGELPPDVNPWSLPGVYLASLDFVKRSEALHPLEHVRWDLLVVDEAHAATPGSDRLAAVHALACRARCVLLLTATPHSGDDQQFEALCAIGAEHRRSPIVCFRRTRADTPLGGSAPRTGLLAVRQTSAEQRMHRLLEEYTGRVWSESRDRSSTNAELVATILRKRALSSPISLALSIRRRLELLAGVPPAPSQLFLPLGEDGVEEDGAPDTVLAGAALSDGRAERRLLAIIADQADRAARSESKVRVLARLLGRVREPAIVFTEYRDTAEHLTTALAASGLRVLLLHGGMSARERTAVIATFTSDGSILVATDAASEGLNLQRHCRLVVHFELPWAPARLHQRRGRVHRIGQDRRVHEIALVARDTCEQLVLVPLLRRAVRSRGLAGTPLVDLIPESRVAAQVLGGIPVAGPDDVWRGSHPWLETLDLREEAVEEVARLAVLRRLKGRRPAGSSTVPIARAKPGWLGSGRSLTLVVDVSLRDRRGRFDQCPFVLSISLPGISWERRHRVLRQQVQRVLSSVGAELDSAVARLGDQRMISIAPARAAAMERARTRNTELQRHLRSTARELVQSGLFDRRALRAAAARDRSREMLLDDLHAPAASATSEDDRVEVTYEVRAIVVGERT